MIYFVSTPIGNLGDISLRALEVLKSVDIIACEDTRTSLKLLNHHGIRTKLVAHHKFNEADSADGLISLSKDGKKIAIISDAGTPALSDPGAILIEKLAKHKLPFTTIPGANALLPALQLSGFCSTPFTFLGFLPDKNSQRKNLLDCFATCPSTLVFYVSPHSMQATLSCIFSSLGARKACLVKEISKLNEGALHFNLGETLCSSFTQKGEFVLVVEGRKKEESDLSSLTVLEHVQFYLNLGESKNNAIKLAAKDRGVKKDVVYQAVINDR